MTENFEEEALENLKKIEKKFNSVEQFPKCPNNFLICSRKA